MSASRSRKTVVDLGNQSDAARENVLGAAMTTLNWGMPETLNGGVASWGHMHNDAADPVVSAFDPVVNTCGSVPKRLLVPVKTVAEDTDASPAALDSAKKYA